MRIRSALGITSFAAVVAVLAGCGGGGASKSAVAVIETELADQIGLGELTAECNEPEDIDVGDQFDCTAETDDEETIELIAVLDDEDRIFVYPTNVVVESEMPRVESTAAQVLSAEVGESIDAGDVDCPSESVVLDAAGQFECVITRASNGDRHRLTVTLTDHVRDEGFQNVEFLIGELIES